MTNMPSRNLLEEAEEWDEKRIEENIQDLLGFIHPVLLDNSSEFELRLDCVRFTVEKISKHVPIYEAEDTLYFPLMQAISAFLTQVFNLISSVDEGKSVELLFVAIDLVGQVDSLIQNGARYEGFGPGEVASIPRVVPKILRSTFQYCSQKSSRQISDEMKDQRNRLFIQSRTLLENFSALVDKMKIRTVLEDELDIVLELCTDLVSLHPILFPLDLKSVQCVWKLYGKLAKEHKERLSTRLDVGQALITLLKEAVLTVDKLEASVRNDTEEKKIKRMVISLSFLVKVICNIASEYKSRIEQEFDILTSFLAFLANKGENIYPYLSEQLREQMDRDIFCLDIPSMVMSLADQEELVDYLVNESMPGKDSFLHVQLAMWLIESQQLSTNEDIQLFEQILQRIGNCQEEFERGDYLESVEEPGVQISQVGFYEWTLVHVCRYLSLVDAEQFEMLEEVLLRNLVGDNDVCSKLCCDIICFIGRYGSAELCLAHLILLSKLYIQTGPKNYHGALIELGDLIGRLFSFLGQGERLTWIEKFSPTEPSYLAVWALIDLNVLENTEPLLILQDIVQAHFDNFLGPSNDGNDSNSLNLFIILLKIRHNLAQVSADLELKSFILALWQKMGEEGVVVQEDFSWQLFLDELTAMTVSVITILDEEEARLLISYLRSLVYHAKGSTSFLIDYVLKILEAISTQDFIMHAQIDGPLILEFGTLSAFALKTAVRDPVLRYPALSFLRNLAARSNNPKLVRECSDENDVLPYFKSFLEEEANDRSTEPIRIEWDYGSSLLEELIEDHEECLQAEMKRTSCSPPPTHWKKLKNLSDELVSPDDIASCLEACLDSFKRIGPVDSDSKRKLMKVLQEMNVLCS